MKFVAITFLAVLAAAAAQTFDPTLPVMILVNTQQSGTDGAGNAITTNTNDNYGYNNASAGVDGAAVYSASTSTDPAYSPITDPCSATYSNDTGCSADATCVSNTTAYAYVYQCSCNSGYNDTSTTTVNPSTLVQYGTTCTDVDQCSNATAVCGTGVDQCIDGLGSFTCNCTSGYNLNNNYCYDEDECSNSTLNNCDADATCANTDGSYTCACNTGYSGNGTYCTDVDECSNSTLNTCSSDATCNNTIGSYTCTCKTGYSGNGTTCVDEDECTLGTDNCAANATCSNTAGSFTCGCNSGYSGDGTNCTDIDECAASTDNCAANATCTNTDGSFTCTCDSGYTGNGTTCVDIDECADSTNNCNVDATCTNTEGSFTCACNAGTIGNGVSTCIVTTTTDYCYRASLTIANSSAVITDADTEAVWEAFLTYIQTNDATSTTFWDAVTVTANGTDGTTGVIAQACLTNMTKTADELTQAFADYYGTHTVKYASVYDVEIQDFDECSNSYDTICYDYNTATETLFYSATCANTNGTYTCACNSSLYDANGDGSKCEDPYSYTCNGTYSTLTLVSSWFNGVGGSNWDVSYMTVNATDCTGAYSSDNTSFIFTDCNANGTWQDNSTIYSPVQVYTNTSGLVYITTSLIDFSYECTQDISQNVTVNFGSQNDTQVAVEDNNVAIQNIFAPDSSTSVDITISQYKQSFTTGNLLTSGSTVKTGELACLQLAVNNAAGVDVQFVKVETRAPGSTSYLDILTNGCATSEATSYGISVDTSYGKGQMCFTMHRPSGTYALEVDLTVNVCVGTCQTITCSSRRRRRRDVSEGETRLVEGYETVFIIDPEDQCDRDCGDGGCVLDFNNEQQCVCNTGAAKVADGTCAALIIDESGNALAPSSSSDNSTLYIIIGVAVGMLILVTILAGFFCFRRRQNAAYKQENYGYKQ